MKASSKTTSSITSQHQVDIVWSIQNRIDYCQDLLYLGYSEVGAPKRTGV